LALSCLARWIAPSTIFLDFESVSIEATPEIGPFRLARADSALFWRWAMFLALSPFYKCESAEIWQTNITAVTEQNK
jgi:hypothetical protein